MGLLMMLERVGGIGPPSRAWQARVLPLNHTRINLNKLYLVLYPIITFFQALGHVILGGLGRVRST
jgi:hypothetical protein